MNSKARYLPHAVIGLAICYLIFAMAPPSEAAGDMQITTFASLPVVEGGRVKPFDTFARVELMILSKRQEYRDAAGKSQPAIRWLLDTMAAGLASYYQRMQVVRITDADLRKLLHLESRPSNRYVVGEFKDHLDALEKEYERVRKVPQGQWNARDEAVADLWAQIGRIIQRIQDAREIRRELAKRKVDEAPIFRIENDQVLALLKLPAKPGNYRYSLTELSQAAGYEQFTREAEQLSERQAKNPDLTDTKILELARHLRIHEQVSSLGGALLVPPAEGGKDAEWKMLGRVLMDADLAGVAPPAAASQLEAIIRAYGLGDTKTFNAAVASYHKTLAPAYANELWTCRLEVWFNHFAPFYQSMLFFVVIAVLAVLSWVSWPEAMNRSAFWLGLLVAGVLTLALGLRMYIQGRPPVTNLYSSAVFIGWGCILLCLYIEYLWRNSLGSLVGAILCFATLLVADHLGSSGDTLEMMQAVLDTNFWLATHVTTVTLGYTATFVAGFFGIIYVVRGLFTTTLDPESRKSISQMIYGTVCFATLLSFVGTVLGGIWADQSWGRFWGWDPKENGALLIVIMNALILHARWGGMIKDRGLAVLAMVGNMVTMWSWFGTNQLGIGLHAYGFNKALVLMCRWFWVSQLALIVAGLVPLRYWRSHLTAPSTPGKAQAARQAPKPGKRESTGVVPAH